MSILVRISS